MAREAQWPNKGNHRYYEPGSVFKVVTASAALEEGTASLASTYYCNGVVNSRTAVPPCLSTATTVPVMCRDLYPALVNSCNPAFMQIGLDLGQERFFEYYQAFGLTEKTGIDLPAERIGVYYDDTMNNISLASCSFGQSNTMTPCRC